MKQEDFDMFLTVTKNFMKIVKDYGLLYKKVTDGSREGHEELEKFAKEIDALIEASQSIIDTLNINLK